MVRYSVRGVRKKSRMLDGCGARGYGWLNGYFCHGLAPGSNHQVVFDINLYRKLRRRFQPYIVLNTPNSCFWIIVRWNRVDTPLQWLLKICFRGTTNLTVWKVCDIYIRCSLSRMDEVYLNQFSHEVITL